MKARQVQRQGIDQIEWYRAGDRVAIARGDPVNHPFFGEQPVQIVGAALDAGPELGCRVEAWCGALFGQRDNLFDGEGRAPK